MEWWNAFTLLQKIFFCIATPATLILIIQIIMMLVGGFGGGDIDADVDVDVDADADFDTDLDAGFTLFTVKGIISFFAVGGWVGFALAERYTTLAIIISVVAGFVALLLMALFMKWLISLQTSGNTDLKVAVGSIAEVYLTIPQKGCGSGKINLTVQDRFIEVEAITNDEEPIKTGSRVKIVELSGSTYVVTKI